MGVVGNAEIVSIRFCPIPPPQPSKRHRLVTGKYVHSSASFLDLSVEGVAEPTITTPTHPFWSETQRLFVDGGQLQAGELVRLANGQSARIQDISPHNGDEAAYNIEVDGEHVYFVSPKGILVHNARFLKAKIKNNDQLSYWGRQLQNGKDVDESKLREIFDDDSVDQIKHWVKERKKEIFARVVF